MLETLTFDILRPTCLTAADRQRLLPGKQLSVLAAETLLGRTQVRRLENGERRPKHPPDWPLFDWLDNAASLEAARAIWKQVPDYAGDHGAAHELLFAACGKGYTLNLCYEFAPRRVSVEIGYEGQTPPTGWASRARWVADSLSVERPRDAEAITIAYLLVTRTIRIEREEVAF